MNWKVILWCVGGVLVLIADVSPVMKGLLAGGLLLFYGPRLAKRFGFINAGWRRHDR